MFPQELENEAIYILREVAAQFKRPVLLFSGGKDSLTLIQLAKKAFWPAPIPFTVLHIDTGHNFPETLAFRDEIVRKYKLKLQVGHVQQYIDTGIIEEEKGEFPSRNGLQTPVLLDQIKQLNADACIGGARRDEEKARAKERVFSVRNRKGEWQVDLQRPELWQLYNGLISSGENVRVFPLSNWTELDVWNYISREKMAVPSLYFAHRRQVLYRDGVLIPASTFTAPKEASTFETQVRFRTVGDMSCTAAIESTAGTVKDIIDEIKQSDLSERGARLDDQRSDAAMEDRKKQGYF